MIFEPFSAILCACWRARTGAVASSYQGDSGENVSDEWINVEG